MTTLAQDIRYGWRMLAKSPMATFIVALTLALGIGANTYVFSIINGYLLRPLPVPEPGRIAVLAAQQAGNSPFLYMFSYPDFLDFRKQAASVADLFVYGIDLGGLSADQKAEQFLFSQVSGNYFSGLGVKPLLGRLILPEEENQPGKQPVLVLGYSYWRKRFAGDPRVVGKQVLVNGQSATIVGVAPKEFHGAYFPIDMDAYVPLGSVDFVSEEARNALSDRNNRTFFAIGRLKPGVSFSQAQASINVIAARLAQQYPATDKNVTVQIYREQLARPRPLGSNLIPIIAGFFLFLAALLLLLACMNVANIVLARATVRQREMGTPHRSRRRARAPDPSNAHRNAPARPARRRLRRALRIVGQSGPDYRHARCESAHKRRFAFRLACLLLRSRRRALHRHVRWTLAGHPRLSRGLKYRLARGRPRR